MKRLKFDLHVDASLLNFRFVQPVYITVHYNTFLIGTRPVTHVTDLTIAPSVAATISNYPELIRQADAAATNNATGYWALKQVLA